MTAAALRETPVGGGDAGWSRLFEAPYDLKTGRRGRPSSPPRRSACAMLHVRFLHAVSRVHCVGTESCSVSESRPH